MELRRLSSQAPIARLLADDSPRMRYARASAIAVGVLYLAAFSQIAFSLPVTPVPITGQTFAVYTLAASLGRRLAFAAFVGYLFAAACGLPVLAGGRSGIFWGPTTGYLLGMSLALAVVGGLSDRGWIRGYGRALGACYLGSTSVLLCGVLGLCFFLPTGKILDSGFWPFLPGDLVKNLLAAAVMVALQKLLDRARS